jgi:hypothetical protein
VISREDEHLDENFSYVDHLTAIIDKEEICL